MDFPDIYNIRKIRKRLKITQTDLAKEAGVSQSLVARIESGLIDPRYSKVVSIFNALKKLNKKEAITVEKFMHKGVFKVLKDEKISKVIEIMKRHNISQVPIFDDNSMVGTISEKILLKHLSKQGIHQLSARKSEEIMEEPFPTVPKDTPVESIIALFDSYPAIAISNKQSITGVLTKSDLLKFK